jgi:serine/threonine-protein kinase
MTGTRAASPGMHSDWINDRFELTSLLKEGNGVATYDGFDHEDRTDIIVKAIDINAVPTAARLRLEHEARVHEQLSLGEKRRIIWSGQEGDLFYLIQPRLDGRTLADILRDGPLSVDSTLKIAANVLGVLETVHYQGVLHRDIKPDNIMVANTDPTWTIELIDFGLSRSGGRRTHQGRYRSTLRPVLARGRAL